MDLLMFCNLLHAYAPHDCKTCACDVVLIPLLMNTPHTMAAYSTALYICVLLEAWRCDCYDTHTVQRADGLYQLYLVSTDCFVQGRRLLAHGIEYVCSNSKQRVDEDSQDSDELIEPAYKQ